MYGIVSYHILYYALIGKDKDYNGNLVDRPTGDGRQIINPERQVVEGMTTIASLPMLNMEALVQEHGNPLNLNSSKENNFLWGPRV